MNVVGKSAGIVLITFQRVAQDETSLRKLTNKIGNRTKGCIELRIRQQILKMWEKQTLAESNKLPERQTRICAAEINGVQKKFAAVAF